MEFRTSTKADIKEISNIHEKAFGEEKGPEISDLVMGLLQDETATPLLSLVAVSDKKIIGHILFTNADIISSTKSLSVRILAPLAVLPENQNSGVGSRLIKEGLGQLKKTGVDLVFVLGHPDYYPKSGFTPAGKHGYEAPYPIPEEHANAWMVQELTTGVIGGVKGKIRCSKVLDQPEHWRE